MTEPVWGDTVCHQCGTHDPIQVKRSRRRGRGTGRPSSIADVMRCPNCGHEWVETKTVETTP